MIGVQLRPGERGPGIDQRSPDGCAPLDRDVGILNGGGGEGLLRSYQRSPCAPFGLDVWILRAEEEGGGAAEEEGAGCC